MGAREEGGRGEAVTKSITERGGGGVSGANTKTQLSIRVVYDGPHNPLAVSGTHRRMLPPLPPPPLGTSSSVWPIWTQQAPRRLTDQRTAVIMVITASRPARQGQWEQS